mmetsp:Transcript_32239/g.96895  ORF Transcript_32239/g.96895 Transcript_32239/m.96895 type:complete len:203 (+) Transcript_32239:2884-3492(+)
MLPPQIVDDERLSELRVRDGLVQRKPRRVERDEALDDRPRLDGLFQDLLLVEDDDAEEVLRQAAQNLAHGLGRRLLGHRADAQHDRPLAPHLVVGVFRVVAERPRPERRVFDQRVRRRLQRAVGRKPRRLARLHGVCADVSRTDSSPPARVSLWWCVREADCARLLERVVVRPQRKRTVPRALDEDSGRAAARNAASESPKA